MFLEYLCLVGNQHSGVNGMTKYLLLVGNRHSSNDGMTS